MDKASKLIVDKYLKLKKEKVLIIYDASTITIMESLKEKSGADTYHLRRPITGFPSDLKLDYDVVIFMAQSRPGELQLFRRPLRIKCLNNKIRLVHMPNITQEIYEDAIGIDIEKVWRFTKKLRKRLLKAKEIIVISEAGTELVARFSKRLRWVSSDGDFRKFDPDKLNLPGAEVFTTPQIVEGKLVVDGLLGDFFVRYRELTKNPVHITIKKSRAVHVKCDNRKLEKQLISYLKTDKNSDRVGEFAFGTNIFLKKYYYNFLVDEKYPGFHLAFGNPYPNRTGADWSSATHLDCLIRNASVAVNNKKIMLGGKYLI